LTDTLPPFPRYPAFPRSEYYGGSAPPAPSAGVRPIQTPYPGRIPDRNGHGWFPRSLLSGRRVRHPALPLRPRHGYAADLHHGLPSQATKTRTGVPRPSWRAGARRHPARIHRVWAGGTSRGV